MPKELSRTLQRPSMAHKYHLLFILSVWHSTIGVRAGRLRRGPPPTAVASRGVYHVPLLHSPYKVPDGQHLNASVAQLAEHALRKRMVMGSIPIRGFL